MKIYTVDLSGAKSPEQIHDKLTEGLELPSWYGRNLDSLYDVLTERSGQIRIEGIRETDDDLEDYLRRLRMVCLDADRDNPLLSIVFD